VAVLPGNLEERRQLLQLWMCEEDPQVFAEHAVADVRVPVSVRGQRSLRVVRVQGAQPFEADVLVDLGEHAIELGSPRDVVPGRVEVARVEADPEPVMPAECLVQRGQLLDRAPDRGTGARGVLDQQPRRLCAARQRLPQLIFPGLVFHRALLTAQIR